MKILLILIAALVATACAPVYKKGDIAYHWVGCHEVHTNPASTGEIAFFLITGWKMEKGDKIFFKQVSTKTDTAKVGPVTTANPC